MQETLHFDPRTEAITSLRSKEEAHDYRYFPEPDLVPLVPTSEMLDGARAALPELPAERAGALRGDSALPADTARLLAFEPSWGDYFEAALRATATRRRRRSPTGCATSCAPASATSDPAASKVTPRALASLVGLVDAKPIIAGAAASRARPARRRGRRPGRDRRARGARRRWTAATSSPGSSRPRSPRTPTPRRRSAAATRRRSGRSSGIVMRETKGRADGGEVTPPRPRAARPLTARRVVGGAP